MEFRGLRFIVKKRLIEIFYRNSQADLREILKRNLSKSFSIEADHDLIIPEKLV